MKIKEVEEKIQHGWDNKKDDNAGKQWRPTP